MRIIGGIRKGHTILCPKSRMIRPTTDFLREYIFNVLNNYTSDSVVLDLFAGTGSLGLEALSRGAAKAIFIEKNKTFGKTLKKNIEKLRFGSISQIIINDVFTCLKNKSNLAQSFDLIFADPPYHSNYYLRLVNLINEKQYLKSNGLFVIEHDDDCPLNDTVTNFKLVKRKEAGKSTISIFENRRGDLEDRDISRNF